ncbi:MAG TPA: hypothetical protein VKQ32_24670 [Polyangia bacterium]|nr:hypothetical protein [Polyangia bacterium]
MSYLYGDSTPSKLEINYIEFLRDAVEFCVQVMLADQRITQGKAHTRTLDHATAAEFERLQKLGGIVSKAFEGNPLGPPDSATARCAAAILRSASDLVRQEAVAMRTALDAEVAKRDAQAAQERDGIAKALEALLVKHKLPDTVMDVHLVIAGGTRYAGRARMKTGFGLDAVMDMDVPSGNLFERIVRVDRLMERLEVLAPEVGGWMKKEVKRRPQHLEKLHILEFSFGADGGVLKLRVGPDGSGAGFDIMFAPEGGAIRMARAEQQEGAGDQSFDVDDDDAQKLLSLQVKLAAAAVSMAGQRKRMVDARLDGEAVRSHAKPTLLAERLIASMAPVVQEIAARSHSPGELVLRRLLGGDRREEIFLSKAELKLKLEPLVEGNRAMFEPLWASTPQAAPKPVVVSDMPTPIAVPQHNQTIRYRPSTPSIGSPSLSSSAQAAAARAAEAVGDPNRRTLIGATVESAIQSAASATAAPAPVAASTSASSKVVTSATAPAAASPSVSRPSSSVATADAPAKAPLDAPPPAAPGQGDSVRRETAPRMEIVRAENSSRVGAAPVEPARKEVSGTIETKGTKTDPSTKN